MTHSSPSLHGLAGDLLGIGRRDVGLGHRVRGADLAAQQRLEPLLLLLGVPTRSSTSMLPVSGAAQFSRLRRDRVLAELHRDVGVVEVREALAGLGVGEEEVPQALRLGLVLDRLEQFQLAVAVAPALGAVLAQPEELGRDRLDLFGDERLDGFVQRLGPSDIRRSYISTVDSSAVMCHSLSSSAAPSARLGNGDELSEQRAGAPHPSDPAAPLREPGQRVRRTRRRSPRRTKRSCSSSSAASSATSRSRLDNLAGSRSPS